MSASSLAQKRANVVVSVGGINSVLKRIRVEKNVQLLDVRQITSVFACIFDKSAIKHYHVVSIDIKLTGNIHLGYRDTSS